MINIRPFTNSDLFTVIGMLKKIANSKLTSLIVPVYEDGTKDSNKKSVEIGTLILSELYDILVVDLQKWFASLYNISVDEYLELPPDTTIDMIDHLTTGENSRAFFLRAYALFKKIKGV